jgi:hypothetical protein
MSSKGAGKTSNEQENGQARQAMSTQRGTGQAMSSKGADRTGNEQAKG